MLPRLRKDCPSVVLSIEDEGTADPAAGGGEPTPEPTPDPGTPTDEEMIPKSEVENIVKKRLERDRRSRRSSPARKPKPSNGEPTVADLMAKMDRQERRHKFDRVALRHNVDDETAEDLFSLWDQSGGDTPAEEFVSSKLAKWKPPQEPKNETPVAENNNEPDPPKAAVTLPPTPRKIQKLDSGELIDVFELNEDELTKLGPRGVRREFERVLEEGRSRSGAPPLPAVLRRKG